MRTKRAAAAIAGLVLAAGFLAGCSLEPPQPAGDTRPPPTTDTEVTASLEASPAPPAGTSPKRATPGAFSRLTVTDVRIGHHDGFDRVVYEMYGTGGPPGWRVQYVNQAVQHGSARQLDIAGQSVLEVHILGSAYPWDSNATPYSGPDPATNPSAPTIAGVYQPAQVYEGTTQSFIGVNADRPEFSVTVLDHPVRLVIDIATE